MKQKTLLITVLFAAVTLAACPDSEKPDSAEQSTEVLRPETRIWKENSAVYQSWNLMPGTEEAMRGKGWHTELATVRLNPVAFGAVETEAAGMPEEAVLIKENFDAEGKLVDIVAVEKQKSGWFWVRYSPEGLTIEAGSDLPACLNCHSMAPNDALFTWKKSVSAEQPAENRLPAY